MAKLWLLKMTRPFFADSNAAECELGDDYDLVKGLHHSLMKEMQPTPEQIEEYGKMSDGGLFDCLRRISVESDQKLNRLEELIVNNEVSLESEMRELLKIFNPKQIAKFIVWVDNNPACMQLLEALWPHLTE